jgi:hypothetical protein
LKLSLSQSMHSHIHKSCDVFGVAKKMPVNIYLLLCQDFPNMTEQPATQRLECAKRNSKPPLGMLLVLRLPHSLLTLRWKALTKNLQCQCSHNSWAQSRCKGRVP